MGIESRYARVLEEVARACEDAGRRPQDVRVVAVSKTVGLSGVQAALEAGAHDFGENRPDSLLPKAQAFPHAAWHFIGNIQSRRIGDIVASSQLVHSLYQEGHALKINEVAMRLGKVQDVLLEVNVSGEQSKSGVAPSEAGELVRICSSLRYVRLRGLMTMAPQGDQRVARECFEGLARLLNELKCSMDPARAAFFNELSMGMSEDWREAVFA
ncbi:MAG: YggS family pyridoxal phosphate-dependent enzyme, partial [Eggerthellaceae bacterium]|nr:YggS family pyridoxal phosphate-dependent enzyme [Eggerthellaceae bacterium]